MTNLALYRKLVEHELQLQMKNEGFDAKRANFSKRLNDETSVWASFQVLKDRAPLLGLFTRIGFYNWKITDFVSRHLMAHRIRGSNIPPTLSATLGYLVPERTQIETYFEPTDVAIRNAISAEVGNLVKYGFPFMTRYPDLKSLSAWAYDPTIEPDASFFQPQLLRAVIFYLLGDWSMALEVIERQLAEAADIEKIQEDPGVFPFMRLKSLLASGKLPDINIAS